MLFFWDKNMSLDALSWAARQSLKPVQKLTLMMLANRHNRDTGQCNPSHARLANDCGLSDSGARKALKELSDLGLIKIIAAYKDNVKLPNQYKLNLHLNIVKEVCHEETGVCHEETGVCYEVAQGMSPDGAGYVTTEQGVCYEVAIKQEVETVNETVNETVYTHGQESASEAKPKPSKTREPKPIDLLLDAGVDEQTAKDFLKVRAAKKRPLTATALKGIADEAAKAGLTVVRAVKIATENGWAGFKASWDWQDKAASMPQVNEHGRQLNSRELLEQENAQIAREFLIKRGFI